MAAETPRTDLSSRWALVRWVCWFLFGTSLVLMGLFLGYIRVMPRPDGLPEQAFLVLSVAGHGLSLGFVPALAAVPLALALPRRGLVWFSTAALACLVVVLVWVDSTVFGLYRFHLNGMVWELLTGGAAADVLPITQATWIRGWMTVSGLVALEFTLAFLAWTWVRREATRGVWVAVAALTVLGSGQVLHTWADARGYVPITRQVRYLPAYHPLTAKRFLRKMGVTVSPPGPRMDAPRPSSGLRYPRTPLQFEGQKPQHNLLIIVSENLRHDFVTPQGTPNLWRFGQRSLVFDNHSSSGNCTRFGIFGLFYGIYGPYFHAVLAEHRPALLMDAVVERGYQLGVFASAPLTSPEFDRTVFARVRDRIPLRTEGAESSVGRDQLITQRFDRFLESRDPARPFFGFLFYDAPHSCSYPEAMPLVFQPSLPMVNHLDLDGSYDPLPYKNRLRNSLHFVDSQIGQVLDHLERIGLLESTVVVVTGDHGQEFNENGLGYWGHNGNFSRYQTRVAMMLRWPDRPPRHLAHRTHHADLAPTILTDLSGCTTAVREYSNGRHLLDAGKREFVVVSNWNAYGVVEEDRIDVVQPTGEVDTHHDDYRDWVDAPLRPKVMVGVLEELSRFYAREETSGGAARGARRHSGTRDR